MIVVDASCLFEVVTGGATSDTVGARLSANPDQAAPHLIDGEVLGAIRRHFLTGNLDASAAAYAVGNLKDWPGDRYSHRGLLDRAWHLRLTVRSWDALYVALAEALDATLLTRDRRLATSIGPTCPIEVV